MSSSIFFIISGNIHIMDAKGHYQYGILGEGSYFGDISAMLGRPNEFSYLYNPFGKQIDVLEISTENWMRICKDHKLAEERFKKRAIRRQDMFQRYKSKILLGYMQTIIKKPSILNIEVDDADNRDSLETTKENLLRSVAKLDNRILLLKKFV
jgi:hypothetical protein